MFSPEVAQKDKFWLGMIPQTMSGGLVENVRY